MAALSPSLPSEHINGTSSSYTSGLAPDVNGSANGTNGTTTAAPTAFDPELFKSYLLALLPPVIGSTPEELEELFLDEEFEDRVSRFAAEGGSVLYVQKVKEEAEDEGPPIYAYHLTSHLTYSARHVSTVALIKRTPVLDTLVPLASQLHILNLFGGDETPYESLHAVVSQAVKPWFDAFVGARGSGKDADGKLGIPMTKRKFAELELSLLHLQQNVEIPETDLVIHPQIRKAVELARSQGVRPTIAHIPAHVLNDSSFLNTLQGHVNIWIKSIQGVTKLSRDVSSGTASQEINFWLSLERALEGIEAQLRSDAVNMVLDCLRNAKRFHATVSFIADTGLKEATDVVHKYNQLMKDFPLNDLLSATDLDKIQEAIIAIFNHINKKLKLSPYPIRRALPLVEAISKDFNDQLLRVLTSHRLTYTPYETFDRLLGQTQELFRTWDDQIKEFTNVAREVTRRRSEKFIPIRIQPAHAKLMERTRYLRDWRKQHEQLALMTGPTRGLANIGKDVGGMDMEEEVKEAYEIIKSIDVLDVSVEGTEIWVTAENAYNERVARIERQLFTYMKRVEDVLGKGWELYAEGQKLQAESTSFRRKLDTKPVFEAWLNDINRRDMGINGRLFEVMRIRGGAGGYQLAVNFDPQTITLFKETRNLLWLGFSVPHAVSNVAKEAKRVYPHAVSLMETVRTYGQTLDLIDSNKGIEMLIAEHRNSAQKMIGKGMSLKWEHFSSPYDHRFVGSGIGDGRENKHVQYVREFASIVSVLQDKANSLIDSYKEISRLVEELHTCPFSFEAFSELIGKIQAAIDRLNLEGYANLDHWVAELDQKVEGILLGRLKDIIQLWCQEFDRIDDGDTRRDLTVRDHTLKRRGDKRTKEEKNSEGLLTLAPVVHEIRIQNQVIFLDPPIEYARDTWIRQLHEWLGIVCRQRRLQSSRYEIGLQLSGRAAADLTYVSLLTRFTDNTLEKPFTLIETKVQQVKEYVAKWLQFQSLWDLEAEYVFNRLGDSLANWQQLLTEIRQTRSTFDNSETQHSFGVVVIDYEQVQSKVNSKYDSWQRDILSRFGVKLGNAMKEMHASILKARHDLESHSIEGLAGGARRF
ncbi:hypothetical protein FRC00_002656 [Tulasnella sp. 408]|nr:hypothetical protein FRC00_002656 [Tulasnella sp. 408]